MWINEKCSLIITPFHYYNIIKIRSVIFNDDSLDSFKVYKCYKNCMHKWWPWLHTSPSPGTSTHIIVVFAVCGWEMEERKKNTNLCSFCGFSDERLLQFNFKCIITPFIRLSVFILLQWRDQPLVYFIFSARFVCRVVF